MSNVTTMAAGIDTGKAMLDIATTAGGTTRVANTPDGHRRLAEWLRERGITRVAIEATGGYERRVVRHLRDTGADVVILQPLQVKGYATFRLRRAKTDAIDAKLIAACGAAMEDLDRVPADSRLEDIANHLTYIEQTEEDIARLKTRLESQPVPALRARLRQEIKRLRARQRQDLADIEQALRQADDAFAKRLDLLCSIDGIGIRTALCLVIRLPELGQVSREKIASLVGVAPFDRQSGGHDGERHIAGGRGRVRRSLYAAALPAAFRWNPALRHLYQRLRAKGNGHKKALIACTRKLVIYANTVIARGTPWESSRA